MDFDIRVLDLLIVNISNINYFIFKMINKLFEILRSPFTF